MGGGEARFVDAIVDVVVGPIVRPFDFFSQLFGKQINLLVLLWEQVVELRVEHADDFAGLIADYFVLLDVVERGNGEATRVIGVDVKVNLSQMGEILMYRIRSYVLP